LDGKIRLMRFIVPRGGGYLRIRCSFRAGVARLEVQLTPAGHAVVAAEVAEEIPRASSAASLRRARRNHQD